MSKKKSQTPPIRSSAAEYQTFVDSNMKKKINTDKQKSTFMEKLLDGIVVEWKTLGEVGELVRGNGLQKKDFTESGVPAIHYGQIYTFYGDYAYQTKSFISQALGTKLRKAQKGDLIIATTSENIEDVCKSLVWLGEDEVCVGGETYIFRHKQNPKYVAYNLKTPIFFDFKKRNQTGSKVVRVHGDKLAEFSIPIPCPDNPKKSLEIQAEIVRILDTFTELTAELTTELKARKKQYTYYRDQLLTFEEGEVEWKTLGEVCHFVRGPFGGSLKKECFVTDGYAVYEQQHAIYDDFTFRYFVTEKKYLEMKRFSIKPGDLIMSCSGTMGKMSIIPKNAKPGIINQALLKLTTNGNVNNKFIKYYFESAMFLNCLNSHTQGGAIKNVASVAILKTIPIPIPPLTEQARIVAILDKFDGLNNSITEGLPREIELRRKQYEYYRNLLLSFPKDGA